jgi:hypothetical protein
MSNILQPEDPADQGRLKRLLDALGPLHLTDHETAALVRIVVAASADDGSLLIRLVRRTRRQAFDLGRLNLAAELDEGDA